MEVGALTKIYSEIYSKIWGEIYSKSLLKILRVKNSNQNFRNLGLSFQILGLKFESLDQNLELVSNLSLKKGGF